MKKPVTHLAKAVAALEATRERTNPIDPIEAMRQWRIEASKNHVRRQPAISGAKKPRK